MSMTTVRQSERLIGRVRGIPDRVEDLDPVTGVPTVAEVVPLRDQPPELPAEPALCRFRCQGPHLHRRHR